MIRNLCIAFSFSITALSAEVPQITVSGEIPFNIIIAQPEKDGCPIRLTMVHRFLQIGTRYVSHVGIAELESTLTPTSTERLLWLNPAGRSYSCQAGVPFSEGSNRWLLQNKDRVVILQSMSGRRTYTYSDGLLIQATDGSETINYHHMHGWVDRVESTSGRLEAQSESSGLRRDVLRTQNKTITLSYNAWGSITEAKVSKGENVTVYQLSYKNDYLAEIRTDAAIQQIEVGECDWTSDYSRNGLFHPVVLQANGMKISIKRNSTLIEGRISDGSAEDVVRWRAVRHGDGFILGQVTGRGDLVLADVDVYTTD